MKNPWITSQLAVAAVLVLGIAVNVLTPKNVDARVRGPRLDSLSAGCGQLQDQYDRAVRDLENASHGSQAQYDAALAALQAIIRQWNDGPCSRHFGSLIYRKIPGVNQAGSPGQQGLPTLAPIRRVEGSSSGGPKSEASQTKGTIRSVLKK
jgi:hypothetical protein